MKTKKVIRTGLSLLMVTSLLTGCSLLKTEENQKKSEENSTETGYTDDVVSFENTNFIHDIGTGFGDYTLFARELYHGVLDENTKTFSHVFTSQEEAEDFVYRFNTMMFPTLDYVMNNGLVLESYNGTDATITIDPETFENQRTYQKFVDLAKSIVSENDSKDKTIEKINEWMVANVTYDEAGTSSNLSTDIFTGLSQSEGISNATQTLLQICGITSFVQVGTVNGENSTWIKVFLDETPYYLDVVQNIKSQNEQQYPLSEELWDDHTFIAE